MQKDGLILEEQKPIPKCLVPGCNNRLKHVGFVAHTICMLIGW